MAGDSGSPAIPTWMHAYVEAWNTHDPTSVLACMTEDVVVEDKGIGERLEGADAVRQMVVDTAQNFSSDYRLALGELTVATDETYAAEWTMSGTNDREDKARGLPNTGRPYSIHGLSIGRLRDGKIAEERMYWNMAEFLTQVGLMPEAPAPATA